MNLINSAGYLGIVLLMFVENVFPPIPSEYIMPLAGFMVAEGKLSLAGIIVAGTFGSLLGALPLYYCGRKLGAARLKRFAGRRGRWLAMSPDDIDRANEWFDRHGAKTVLLCRLVPGVRSLISIPAGINRMNLLSFLFFTTVGSAVWSSVLAYAGYLLGSNFHEVEEYFDPISLVIFGVIIILYLWRVIRGSGKTEAGN
jgi:membrane protein DedA with SNARE-associated domain